MADMKQILNHISGTCKSSPISDFERYVWINKGHIYSADNTLHAKAPWPYAKHVRAVDGQVLVKALTGADNESVSQSKRHGFTVKRGRLRVEVPGLDAETVQGLVPSWEGGVEGKGAKKPVYKGKVDAEAFTHMLKQSQPFIGSDTIRQWMLGVLLRGSSAYAVMNGIAIARVDNSGVDIGGNDAVIPARTVAELLRMDASSIEELAVYPNAIVLDWGDRTLSSKLIDIKWPADHQISPLLEAESEDEWTELPKQLSRSYSSVAPYVEDNWLEINEKNMRTLVAERQAQIKWDKAFLPKGAAYRVNAAIFKNVLNAADEIRWPTDDSGKILFRGNGVTGVLQAAREN